ncbi:hypothetical protein [Paludisphaera soli]|nr:hypothetical protein [Paludisphaera soli]
MANAKKKGGGETKKKACWEGYERVPGKKAGTKGSCKKKGT